MKFLSSLLLTISVLGIIFPVSVFAKSDQVSEAVRVKQEKVQNTLNTANQVTQNLGIEYFDQSGQKTDLIGAVRSMSDAKKSTLSLVVPANDRVGLKKSFGMRIRQISIDTDQAIFSVTLTGTGQNSSSIISQQRIAYDFTKTDTENNASMNIIFNKMAADLGNDYVSSNSSTLQKIFNLIIPQAKADELTIGDLLGGILCLSISVFFGWLTFKTIQVMAFPQIIAVCGMASIAAGAFGLMILQPLYQPILDHRIK